MDNIILHIFHTGKVRVDRAIPLHERNPLAAKALDWLIDCKKNPACMGVFVNHDPTVKEQTLEVQL